MNLLEFTLKHCKREYGAKMQAFVQDLASVDTSDWGNTNEASLPPLFLRAKRNVLGAGEGASVSPPTTAASAPAVAPTPAPSPPPPLRPENPGLATED